MDLLGGLITFSFSALEKTVAQCCGFTREDAASRKSVSQPAITLGAASVAPGLSEMSFKHKNPFWVDTLQLTITSRNRTTDAKNQGQYIYRLPELYGLMD